MTAMKHQVGRDSGTCLPAQHSNIDVYRWHIMCVRGAELLIYQHSSSRSLKLRRGGDLL